MPARDNGVARGWGSRRSGYFGGVAARRRDIAWTCDSVPCRTKREIAPSRSCMKSRFLHLWASRLVRAARVGSCRVCAVARLWWRGPGLGMRRRPGRGTLKELLCASGRALCASAVPAKMSGAARASDPAETDTCSLRCGPARLSACVARDTGWGPAGRPLARRRGGAGPRGSPVRRLTGQGPHPYASVTISQAAVCVGCGLVGLAVFSPRAAPRPCGPPRFLDSEALGEGCPARNCRCLASKGVPPLCAPPHSMGATAE